MIPGIPPKSPGCGTRGHGEFDLGELFRPHYSMILIFARELLCPKHGTQPGAGFSWDFQTPGMFCLQIDPRFHGAAKPRKLRAPVPGMHKSSFLRERAQKAPPEEEKDGKKDGNGIFPLTLHEEGAGKSAGCWFGGWKTGRIPVVVGSARRRSINLRGKATFRQLRPQKPGISPQIPSQHPTTLRERETFWSHTAGNQFLAPKAAPG